MRSLLIALFIIIGFNVSAQDTLTIMSYNILNYPSVNPTKADTLKPIIQHVQPDIFMITELTSVSGVNTILNDALNVDGITSYQAATYYNGPDSDNMLYFNSDKLELYSQYQIPTVLRDISEYVLYYKYPGMTAGTDTVFIYCYMAHLKASSGSANEIQRNQEATALKNYMSTRPNIENVILGGDFNLYTSAESAYSTILNLGSVPLLDPISTPGAWNNNAAFANVHTQSTRSTMIGDGGAFGGMDDRFDFIFFNNDLLSGGNRLTYISNTYTAVGNDGNHFNLSLNDLPTNTAAPANVIDALYYMSDHLPITIKAYIDATVGSNEIKNETEWSGYFHQGVFNFKSDQVEKNLTVVVYDVLGKIIQRTAYKNQREIQLKIKGLVEGTYLVKVVSASKQQSFKILKNQ